MIDFSGWTKATGDLKPGQQRVFKDFLTLVSEGQATLVHGADYDKNSPCLVNGVAPMLAHTAVSPMGMFPDVVTNFDHVCREMQAKGIGEQPNRVSPLMAEFLLKNFGEMKDMEVGQGETPYLNFDVPYVEPSDQDMMCFIEKMMDTAAPDSPVENPITSDDESMAEHRRNA